MKLRTFLYHLVKKSRGKEFIPRFLQYALTTRLHWHQHYQSTDIGGYGKINLCGGLGEICESAKFYIIGMKTNGCAGKHKQSFNVLMYFKYCKGICNRCIFVH